MWGNVYDDDDDLPEESTPARSPFRPDLEGNVAGPGFATPPGHQASQVSPQTLTGVRRAIWGRVGQQAGGQGVVMAPITEHPEGGTVRMALELSEQEKKAAEKIERSLQKKRQRPGMESLPEADDDQDVPPAKPEPPEIAAKTGRGRGRGTKQIVAPPVSGGPSTDSKDTPKVARGCGRGRGRGRGKGGQAAQGSSVASASSAVPAVSAAPEAIMDNKQGAAPKSRAQHGTQNCFAGRRPPQSPEKRARFECIAELARTSGIPTTHQMRFYFHMQAHVVADLSNAMSVADQYCKMNVKELQDAKRRKRSAPTAELSQPTSQLPGPGGKEAEPAAVSQQPGKGKSQNRAVLKRPAVVLKRPASARRCPAGSESLSKLLADEGQLTAQVNSETAKEVDDRLLAETQEWPGETDEEQEACLGHAEAGEEDEDAEEEIEVEFVDDIPVETWDDPVAG